MSPRPALRVALPWLHDAIVEARAAGSLPPLPSFAWLAGRGVAAHLPQGDWRQWLLGTESGASDVLRRWPAGPSLATAMSATQSCTPGSEQAPCWAVAQPVHFAAGMDHLRLAPLADAVPTVAEAAQLTASLNDHFVDDGLEFGGLVDGAWPVRCRTPFQCSTCDPATAVGRNVHDFLPAGAEGARVRSLMNEIQMLLHEHPVNQRRAARRALPINGLWLWGFGAVDVAHVTGWPTPGRWTLYADDLWLRSLWRSHGGVVRDVGEAVAETTGPVARTRTSATADAPGVTSQPSPTADALIVLTQPPTTDPAEVLIEVDSSLLARLRRGVRSGGLRSLDLFDGARVHALDAYSRWRIWRRPATPDEALP